jgi:hypothetical protein
MKISIDVVACRDIQRKTRVAIQEFSDRESEELQNAINLGAIEADEASLVWSLSPRCLLDRQKKAIYSAELLGAVSEQKCGGVPLDPSAPTANSRPSASG